MKFWRLLAKEQVNPETREDHITVQEFCLIILENLKKQSASIRSFFRCAERLEMCMEKHWLITAWVSTT